MMRSTKRTFSDETRASCQAGDGMNLSQLQRGLELQRRHDRRQTFREHRFAGTRWSNEQNVVSAGNRNLKGALRRHLSPNFLEVDVVMCGPAKYSVDVNFHRRRWLRGTQPSNELHRAAQIRNRIDIDACDHRCFFCILFRQYQMT